MKLSEALTAGLDIPDLESVGLVHCGYRGELDDRENLIAWLRQNPAHDGQVRHIALATGRKKIRRKQPKFHQKVGDAYGWKCAITGESAEPVLEAAHLPGRKHELGHNDARDGILLRVDLHRLMDGDPPLLRIVRENDELVVRVDPQAGPNYAELDGKKIRIPKRVYDRPAL